MKTYNVTIWNKANKLHATYNAYGVKDLLKSMVGITSFYQPDAIKLLASSSLELAVSSLFRHISTTNQRLSEIISLRNVLAS